MTMHHVALATRDLAATADFYTDVMGFELVKTVVSPSPEGGWSKHVFFDTGDGSCIAFWELHIDAIDDSWSPAISTGMGLPPWVNHLAFRCSLDELAGRTANWTAAGYDVLEVDHDFCVSVYTMDPNGILVEWCADRRAFDEADRAHARAALDDPAPAMTDEVKSTGTVVHQADPEAKAARRPATV